MALIGEELATDAMLDKVLCICPSCRPVKTCTEGLAYQCPSCSVVAAESGKDFVQELLPFLFGDASLEHSGARLEKAVGVSEAVGLRLVPRRCLSGLGMA